MTHLWVRAEARADEQRVGLTPMGAAELLAQGLTVTVEHSHQRAIAIDGYRDAGCQIAPEGAWKDAPNDAIIFGLKELPEDGTPLRHRHIMFGHAYKGQPLGRILLDRFKAGGGTLYDLEYLEDQSGRRVAAFGYWAGFAGAAMSLACWSAQQAGSICGAAKTYPSRTALTNDLQSVLGAKRPSALIIGALGRVGTGASDLCTEMGMRVTKWDMAETASGGPFPEVLEHDIFLNCILARPGTPVFVARRALTMPRALSVIGDIACDPDSKFSPIKVYDRTTTWAEPALRVQDEPVLDVMAIDNLPAMMPVESSTDFAEQLLPTLRQLGQGSDVWARAQGYFTAHL